MDKPDEILSHRKERKFFHKILMSFFLFCVLLESENIASESSSAVGTVMALLKVFPEANCHIQARHSAGN